MIKVLFFLLMITASSVAAQNRNTIFYDSIGQLTTFEGHWSQVVTGKYKSIYDKKQNAKSLVKATKEESEVELRKTEKRITKADKIGTDFPDFDLTEVNGDRLRKSDFKGKVIVFNFWFIGCAPCEMERPALNELRKHFNNDDRVVFISVARNTKEELVDFLKEHPILYQVTPTGKEYIKTNFEVNAYPVNLIIGKDGKYFYNSSGSGIGIMTILLTKIDEALKGK